VSLKVGMAKKGVLSLFLLLAICWRSRSDNPPCDPKVFSGASFSDFVTQKNCDVDERLLKLFTDEDSFKVMLDKAVTNVMCIGFIEAFNMTSEDSCTYDYLAHIPSEDFCKNSKALDVLVLANDSSVFDEHYRVVEVANFVLQHCDYMCSDATGSNELCWSFNEVVKLVMKHHVSTPPIITTTSPSSDTPATAQPTDPSWLGLGSKKASHEKDSNSTTVHDGDSGVGGTNNGDVSSIDKSSTSTTGTGSATSKPLPNTLSGEVQSSPSLDTELLFSKDISTPSSSSSTDAPPDHSEVPIQLGDKQHANVDANYPDEHPNISDTSDQHPDSPNPHPDTPGTPDQHPDSSNPHPDTPGTPDQHPDSPDPHPDTPGTPDQHPDSPDLHPNTSSSPDEHPKTLAPNGDNLDAIPGQDNLPPDSSGDMISVDEPGDKPSHLQQGLPESDDKDQIAVSSDTGKSGTGNVASKDRGGYEYDDDEDDDDGYSYWHFAAVLLFILFLGVATYLATLNRKKVCCVCVVCMRVCIVCVCVCVVIQIERFCNPFSNMTSQ